MNNQTPPNNGNQNNGNQNNGYNNINQQPQQIPMQAIPTYQVAVVDDKSGLGIASLICGIISLLTCAWSIIFPLLSIIFACLARNPLNNNKMHTSAKIGLILTIISLLPCIILILVIALGGFAGCASCVAAG